jgi:predicted Zn-dependent protease
MKYLTALIFAAGCTTHELYIEYSCTPDQVTAIHESVDRYNLELQSCNLDDHIEVAGIVKADQTEAFKDTYGQSIFYCLPAALTENWPAAYYGMGEVDGDMAIVNERTNPGNILSRAMHEMGHWLGAEHVDDRESVMSDPSANKILFSKGDRGQICGNLFL